MQQISLVVAMNQDRVIGVNNQLPWHIPEDLAYFKAVTLGKPIIMGRKTFESIGRALPGRKNIVISRSGFSHPNVTVYPSLDDALTDNSNEIELAIIGGGEIFKQSLDLATKLYLTVVEYVVENPSVWFPDVDLSEWELVERNSIISKSGISCTFNQYQRNL